MEVANLDYDEKVKELWLLQIFFYKKYRRKCNLYQMIINRQSFLIQALKKLKDFKYLCEIIQQNTVDKAVMETSPQKLERHAENRVWYTIKNSISNNAKLTKL